MQAPQNEVFFAHCTLHGVLCMSCQGAHRGHIQIAATARMLYVVKLVEKHDSDWSIIVLPCALVQIWKLVLRSPQIDTQFGVAWKGLTICFDAGASRMEVYDQRHGNNRMCCRVLVAICNLFNSLPHALSSWESHSKVCNCKPETFGGAFVGGFGGAFGGVFGRVQLSALWKPIGVLVWLHGLP